MENKTILLVEDEQQLLISTSRLLQDHFNVISAPDAVSALKSFKAETVDCIILDIVMPGMSGLEFLKKIRDDGSSVPVIIVTGNSRLQYAEDCANLGVSGYFNKPYEIGEIVEKINSIFKLLDSKEKGDPKDQYHRKDAHPKLKQVLDYIHRNYSGQISPSAISKEIGISYGHLADIFKKEEGVTFKSYLNRLRVEKAKELIRDTELPMNEIIEKVGFGTEQHFFNQFKKHTGVTPSHFRK